MMFFHWIIQSLVALVRKKKPITISEKNKKQSSMEKFEKY
jgi:hypothetical protein